MSQVTRWLIVAMAGLACAVGPVSASKLPAWAWTPEKASKQVDLASTNVIYSGAGAEDTSLAKLGMDTPSCVGIGKPIAAGKYGAFRCTITYHSQPAGQATLRPKVIWIHVNQRPVPAGYTPGWCGSSVSAATISPRCLYTPSE